MYIEDCLSALLQFLNAPQERLRRRVYNVTAMSFTPEELFAEVKKHIPDLHVSYNPDSRQNIGNFTLEISYGFWILKSCICIEKFFLFKKFFF